VFLWKRVLTSTEQTQLYNAGSGQSFPFVPLGSPSRGGFQNGLRGGFQNSFFKRPLNIELALSP
jgi:hypothetical protein